MWVAVAHWLASLAIFMNCRFSERPYLKKTRWRAIREYILCGLPVTMCACVHMHTLPHKHTCITHTNTMSLECAAGSPVNGIDGL